MWILGVGRVGRVRCVYWPPPRYAQTPPGSLYLHLQKKTTKARYVFVYRKNAQGKWEIIDHHSSAMPTPPAGLKRALTCAPP